MSRVVDQFTDEERILYNSAVSVRRSEFWIYYIEKVADIIESNKEAIVDFTLRGDEKGALIAASKIRGLELAKEEMDAIIDEVNVMTLNQELEEEDA